MPHEVAFYTPSPGDRIRIGLLDGADAYRPILWMKLGKDGSIYLAPRVEDVATVKRGSKVLEHGSVTVKYDEGEEVADRAAWKRAKLSLHASGVVNLPGGRAFCQPLRNIDSQREVCKLLFAHPSTFAVDRNIGSRDIVLRYPVHEDYPLMGSLFASPPRGVVVVQTPGALHQVTIVLPFAGLIGCGALTLQLVLHHGARGAWPPLNYILFPAKPV